MVLFKRRWTRALLVLVAVAIAGFAGFRAYANRPLAVPVAKIETNVPVRVFGLGTVEARVLSKIGFEVGATLTELHADHGDVVTKGQVLARLKSGEQEARLAKAEAALRIAEANTGRADANLDKAQAVVAQRRDANQRRQALAGRDIVSQQAAEESARDEAVAAADVSVAQSEVASAKAQLADAQAQLRFEETMLGHRTLVAPYDAVVVARHTELGTVVKPGDPLFTVMARNSHWGLAYVDEARAGLIVEGQPVTARLRSRPRDEFTGKVVRIGLESDRVTEERRVYIRGDHPPERIFLGEQVEFWIEVATLEKALLVPEAAVQGFDGRQASVWLIKDGALHQQRVEIGHRTEDARLEVLGLADGVQVATQIGAGFREGRAAHAAGVEE